MLMINNSVELIRPVNGSREKHAIVMPQSAKHDEYSSFSKLENHDKQFCRTHTAREWLERQTCYSNAQKRKTFSKRENHDKQFCRTHTTREWLERQTCYSNGVMPQSAKHDEYSSFSKRENRKALRPKTHANQAVTKSGTGTWDLGRGTRGRGTRGRGDVGRGDAGTRRLGDAGTRGRGDAGTPGRRDVGLGDAGTRGRGDVGLENVGTRDVARRYSRT